MAAAVAYLDRVQPALDRAADRFRWDVAVLGAVSQRQDPGVGVDDPDATAHGGASVVARYADGVEGGGTSGGSAWPSWPASTQLVSIEAARRRSAWTSWGR